MNVVLFDGGTGTLLLIVRSDFVDSNLGLSSCVEFGEQREKEISTTGAQST